MFTAHRETYRRKEIDWEGDNIKTHLQKQIFINENRLTGYKVNKTDSGSDAGATFRTVAVLSFNPLAPNDINMSYHTANLQMLHFIYFLNKYTYWIF